MTPLPLPYRILQSLIRLSTSRSDRWWLSARPAWRLVRVARELLRAQLEVPFDHKDPATIPAYMRSDMWAVLEQLDTALSKWVTNVAEWRDSLTLCSLCGAPLSDLTPGPCPRCPRDY